MFYNALGITAQFILKKKDNTGTDLIINTGTDPIIIIGIDYINNAGTNPSRALYFWFFGYLFSQKSNK